MQLNVSIIYPTFNTGEYPIFTHTFEYFISP